MSTLNYTTSLTRSSARLERLVLAMGLCLPVPLLAATGLSLPMPGVVERLAAALVPWADAATEAWQPAVATRGSIVRGPGELEAGSATGDASDAVPAATSARAPFLRTGLPRDAATAPTPADSLGPRGPGSPPRGGTKSVPASADAPGAVAPAAAEPKSPAAPSGREAAVPAVTATAPPAATPPQSDPVPTTPGVTTPSPLDSAVKTVEPVIEPVQPVVDAVAPVLEPVAKAVEPVAKAVEPVTEPVAKAVDTVTGSLPPPPDTLPRLGG